MREENHKNTKSLGLEEDLGEVLCDRVESTYPCRGFCSWSVENIIRERKMEITIDSKVNGLEEERSYREKKVKLDEIRERLSRLKELLQN